MTALLDPARSRVRPSLDTHGGPDAPSSSRPPGRGLPSPVATEPDSDLSPPPVAAREAAPPATSRRAVLGMLAGSGLLGVTAVVSATAGGAPGSAAPAGPALPLVVTVTGISAGPDSDSPGHDPAGHGGPPPGGEPGPDGGRGPDGAGAPDELGHRVWARRVHVVLLLENPGRTEVLYAPGQLRLRLADGTTVQPVAWGVGAGPLPPRSSTASWVDYLAPDGDGAAEVVEWTAAGAAAPVTLRAGDTTGRARTSGSGR